MSEGSADGHLTEEEKHYFDFGLALEACLDAGVGSTKTDRNYHES